MTADKLQSAVRVLANGSWCRYWLAYTVAADGGTIMAIQCRDETGKTQRIPDAKAHGFAEHNDHFYTIPRTNDDGTPYVSKLIDAPSPAIDDLEAQRVTDGNWLPNV